ncbi:chromosome partitioning protein ParA [Pseudomonas syringae ICMP 11293]|uniref:DUF4398 domain-containing protein n=1 Tax=Pseudomonas syringae TaxID=317 RepID=UPI000730DD07|nr:DUF4398 domain-containing protein [Pseudomonas syringae]KTB91375.1 chromosome partitioning protein ParA [Pseudomonas syringae ICMP 11293]
MTSHTEITVPKRPQSATNHGVWIIVLATACALVSGCAGNPPSAEIAVSQSAVNSAVDAGGTEYSAVAMKSAQDKLKSAQVAVQDEDYERARILAEQAEWDARLAERQAMAVKANKILQDARQGARELRDEGLLQVQPTPAL